jgi:hypothetical protein
MSAAKIAVQLLTLDYKARQTAYKTIKQLDPNLAKEIDAELQKLNITI